MGLKIFSLFILLYMTTISYLILSKEKYTNTELKNKKEIPLIEFENIKNYHLTKNGVDTVIKAKKALRFYDRDEIKDVDILTFQRGKKERLRAKEANYKNNIIYLYGNIIYKNEENLTLISEEMIYKLKKKIISSKSPFTLIAKKVKINGKSFVYNRQKGIIEALKIEAIIKDTKKTDKI